MIKYQDRKTRFSKLFEINKADALLITDLNNVRYLSGFTGSSAAMLLMKDKSYLFTDGRYRTQSGEEVKDSEIIIQKKILDDLLGLLKKEKVKSLAFEAENLSYSRWSEFKDGLRGIELVPLDVDSRKLRSRKSPDEVDKIRLGAEIAKEALILVLEMIKPGISEKDVALSLEVEARRIGADRVSFDIIVASGKNSALPHARPGEKKIEDGDLVIVDFGVVVEGYHTDETCTFRVGKVDKKSEEIFSVVWEAHDRAIEAVKPGVKAVDVDKIARNYIREKGYGEYFSHGTGHGVGLEIHEFPVISEKSDDLLEEGMVLTIEPGIYVPSLGGVRIEDMLLVTSSGFEVITKSNDYLRG